MRSFPILLGVEEAGATPEQMQHIANERLPDVWEYLQDRTWCQEYVKAFSTTPGLELEECLLCGETQLGPTPRGRSPVKSDEPPMWLIGFLCLRGILRASGWR